MYCCEIDGLMLKYYSGWTNSFQRTISDCLKQLAAASARHIFSLFMRSSRMRDESIKDLHMGKSEVGTRGVRRKEHKGRKERGGVRC